VALSLTHCKNREVCAVECTSVEHTLADRVETPSGAGTVVGLREDGTYDVQLDSSETVQNFDGPTMKEETTHFDAAVEDSGDEKEDKRRRERMERLTMDKHSICERAGANANAGADKCETQNWCVSDGETVKAGKSQIGIGDTAVFKVSYATNSVCVEGSQSGGDGRVKKVTVAVHKWVLVTDTELQVITVRPPSFRSSTATDPRIKWSTLDSSDLSSD
jgi:hypothetical protein